MIDGPIGFVCLQGKVHSKDVRCCGTEELKESHLCRNDIGRQIAKEEPTHDRLCCKPRKCHTFDSQTQVGLLNL